jgi:hypothetical protein
MAAWVRFGTVLALLAGLSFADLLRSADAQSGMMGGSRTGMQGMMGKGRMEPPPAGGESRFGAEPSPNRRQLAERASGSKAFDQVCGTCHALPNPGVHTADQWPQVVERMRQLLAAGGGSLDRRTAGEIDAFLESEAQRQ